MHLRDRISMERESSLDSGEVVAMDGGKDGDNLDLRVDRWQADLTTEREKTSGVRKEGRERYHRGDCERDGRI